MKDKSNLKAAMGSIVHKVMEILALRQVSAQKKESFVYSDDFGQLSYAECDDIEFITRLSYNFYKEAESTLTFTEKEFNTCLEWSNKAIEYNNGIMDPRNQNIVTPELFFDIEIKKDWAWFEYEVGSELISGYLSIKGTIDLILNESEGVFHMLDYKTGKRYDWGKDKEKDQAALEKDNQLLLYYYALKNMYPDKEFYISIYYINDGGVFTFPFDEHDYEKAESMIRQKFKYIQSVQYPTLLSSDNSHFKCKHMCAFSKPHDLSGKSICQHFRDEILKKGIDRVTEKNANLKKIRVYGDGGGRLNESK